MIVLAAVVLIVVLVEAASLMVAPDSRDGNDWMLHGRI